MPFRPRPEEFSTGTELIGPEKSESATSITGDDRECAATVVTVTRNSACLAPHSAATQFLTEQFAKNPAPLTNLCIRTVFGGHFRDPVAAEGRLWFRASPVKEP
jgi:hypothetical protein